MKVYVNRQCDVYLPTEKKALWPGQIYDLSPEAVEGLVASGAVDVVMKAVESAPENKAVEAAPVTKRKYKRRKGARHGP